MLFLVEMRSVYNKAFRHKSRLNGKHADYSKHWIVRHSRNELYGCKYLKDMFKKHIYAATIFRENSVKRTQFWRNLQNLRRI